MCRSKESLEQRIGLHSFCGRLQVFESVIVKVEIRQGEFSLTLRLARGRMAYLEAKMIRFALLWWYGVGGLPWLRWLRFLRLGEMSPSIQSDTTQYRTWNSPLPQTREATCNRFV